MKFKAVEKCLELPTVHIASRYKDIKASYDNIPTSITFSPSNAKLNPICHLLALLGARHILHVSRIRVNLFAKSQESLTTNTFFKPHCYRS